MRTSKKRERTLEKRRWERERRARRVRETGEDLQAGPGAGSGGQAVGEGYGSARAAQHRERHWEGGLEGQGRGSKQELRVAGNGQAHRRRERRETKRSEEEALGEEAARVREAGGRGWGAGEEEMFQMRWKDPEGRERREHEPKQELPESNVKNETL